MVFLAYLVLIVSPAPSAPSAPCRFADWVQANSYAMYGLAGRIAASRSVARRSLLDGIFNDLSRSLLTIPTPTFDFTDINTLRTLIQQASNAMAAASSSALGSGSADPTLVANAITAVTNLQTGLNSLSTPISLTQVGCVISKGGLCVTPLLHRVLGNTVTQPNI
jgi:hypothetical protein